LKIYSLVPLLVTCFIMALLINAQSVNASQVPAWVKNLFVLYQQNKISAKELNDAISSLIQNKVITVNASNNHVIQTVKKTATLPQNNTNPKSTPSPALPTPTKSWKFNSIPASMISGKVDVEKDANGYSLNLDGNGWLQQKDNRVENYSKLTISAWVRPDYSQGSAIFTILSKHHAFGLAINNNIPTPKHATFAIFDGIRWNVLESKNEIPEKWTYLVGVFDGLSMKMYVNGKLESSQSYAEPQVVAVYESLTKTTSFISSSDICIGAYVDKTRNEVNYKFSGSIKDLNLYERALTSAQINQIYKKFAANYPQ
jgi:Concanavalin A-like lectin/glucanases superfamily